MAESMTFTKETTDERGMVHGHLTLSNKSYAVVSGPYGHGSLPDGTYTIKTREVVDRGLPASYKAGGTEFFIPITPDFETDRDGFGIHPDGGSAIGTKGCVGLVGRDALTFWNAWTAISLGHRPTSLVVTSP